jgi:hypothetical protein
LNIEGLVVVSGSDGQRWLMEVPCLSLSSIWSLDDHVSVVDEVEVSVAIQIGDDIEISFNIDTELLVKLALSWFLFVFVNIDNSKSLVDLTISVFNLDVSVLSVKSS